MSGLSIYSATGNLTNDPDGTNKISRAFFFNSSERAIAASAIASFMNFLKRLPYKIGSTADINS